MNNNVTKPQGKPANIPAQTQFESGAEKLIDNFLATGPLDYEGLKNTIAYALAAYTIYGAMDSDMVKDADQYCREHQQSGTTETLTVFGVE